MALRFIDSCSHYATANITKKWTNTNLYIIINSTGGRRGAGALYTDNTGGNYYVSKTLDNQATWIVGFAMKSNLAATGTLIGFMDGIANNVSYIQCYLTLSNAGVLSIVRGNGGSPALIASTASAVISANTWYYIEIKVTIADSPGAAYEIRVNGVNVLSASGVGVDTKQTANAYANIIEFFAAAGGGSGVTNQYCSSYTYISDIYICDGTGVSHNDFLGDCRVDAYLANGAGNSSQFTPSAGSNYQNVDEASPDADTTYNESNTVGHIDLYTMADMTHTPSVIHAVQTCLFAGKSDAGTRTIREKCRSGGNNYDGTTVSPSVDYSYVLQQRIVDPATNSAWTKTNFNNAEFGIEIVS